MDPKALRDAFFVPCRSKEELHRWIELFLGLNVPDCIVCDDDVTNPPSNSSPMDLLYEIYSKALEGTDPDFTQVLGFSARDAFKTLSAAIIEILCLFHLRRSVAHLAAVETQARKCQSYCEKFLNRPILRDYLISKNKRTLEVAWYERD